MSIYVNRNTCNKTQLKDKEKHRDETRAEWLVGGIVIILYLLCLLAKVTNYFRDVT